MESGWGVGLLHWLDIATVRRWAGVGLLHWLQTAPWSQARGVGLLHWLEIASSLAGEVGLLVAMCTIPAARLINGENYLLEN